MRIRDKFTGILGIVFLNVVVIVALSLVAMAELKRYQTTAERGTELITRSRTVFNLMKDLSISAFAPDTWGRMKDVFYYEKFDTTLRNWEEAVGGFHQAYRDFMNDPLIRQMSRTDPLMGDEYATAQTMSDKAFSRLDSLMAGFAKLAASGFLSQEDSYQRIVASSDQQIAGLFSEVRVSSYYLRNNFESFMNHFVNAVNDRIAATRDTLTWSFLAVTLLSVAVSLALALIFGNRIIRNVRTIRNGMADISRGDFSHHIAVASHDELGELAGNINSLAEELKARISRLLHVTRDIGSGIDADTNLQSIRGIIVETAARESGAGGVAFLPRPGSVLGDAPPVCAGSLATPRRLAQALALVEAAAERAEGDRPREGAGGVCPPEGSGGDRPRGPGDAADRAGGDRPRPGGAANPVEARFLVPESAEGDRPFSSLIVCPLPAPHAAHGQLMAVTDAGAMPFTDLDFTVLQSHADFAALSIDNYLKYRQLIELREAEYQSLQARIQPHFLYNVMNGLIGLNRMGEKAAVEAAVLDLKDLLRYTLDHERTVSLEEELGFVRKYLDLQKLRFGERFDYRVSCAPACAALAIPKLLLQPLAENALIHGIEPMARNGLLEIDASGDPAVGVRVSIADNGAGFDPATRDATSRIGLSNVIKRLELAYPGSVFAIRSAPGQGCRVEIEIRPPGGQP